MIVLIVVTSATVTVTVIAGFVASATVMVAVVT